MARAVDRPLPTTTEALSLLSADVLRPLSVNPLGAYCLGLADAYEPSGAPATPTALTVFPSLWLQAGEPLSPDERLFRRFARPLARWATAWRRRRQGSAAGTDRCRVEYAHGLR